jgi:hypothetical protein
MVLQVNRRVVQDHDVQLDLIATDDELIVESGIVTLGGDEMTVQGAAFQVAFDSKARSVVGYIKRPKSGEGGAEVEFFATVEGELTPPMSPQWDYVWTILRYLADSSAASMEDAEVMGWLTKS